VGANYNWFLEELEKKNICIREKVSPLAESAGQIGEVVGSNKN
jgi:hypothetical protein